MATQPTCRSATPPPGARARPKLAIELGAWGFHNAPQENVRHATADLPGTLDPAAPDLLVHASVDGQLNARYRQIQEYLAERPALRARLAEAQRWWLAGVERACPAAAMNAAWARCRLPRRGERLEALRATAWELDIRAM